MTYIYPNYYRVQPQPNSRLSKKYTLYLYREGYVDSEQLVGVPALFIPGQAGSYKQVRSIASETSKESYLKKASKSMQDIDWFTLDLNEELTAFAGQHILDQATYCNTAIETILDLYKGKVNSVIIVGHSMGGIVSRTILMQPNYIPNSINTIFTLATPHLNPPILLDPVLDQVYHDLSRYWQPSQFEIGALQEVTLVSIAGGSLDTIVHSDSIGLQHIVPDSHGFATYSTAIPFVWTGSDHMAILWCNQLVKRLAATLVEAGGSFKNVSERMGIFRRYLLEEQLDSFKKQEFNISKNVQILNLSNQKGYRSSATINGPRLSLVQNTRSFHFLTDIPKEYDDQWQLVTCEKSGLDQWMCKTIRPTITLLPSASAESLVGSIPYRSINAKLDQPVSYIGLMEKGEVVIPNHPFIIIHNDSTTVHKSTIWDIVRHKGEMLTVKGYYSKHIFPQLYHPLFAYDLHVVQSTPKAHTIFEPMMKQTIHGKEAKFYRNLKENVSDKIMFHQTSGDEGLAFSFYTDNQALELLIRVDWYATLGRCMLRYGSILTNYLYVCASLILFTQSYTYVATLKKEFASYKETIIDCMSTTFMQVILFLLLISACQYYITSNQFITEPSFLYKLMTKDLLFGSDEPMLIVMSPFLFILAVGLMGIIWLAVTFVVIVMGILFKFLYRPLPVTLSESKQFTIHLSIVLASIRFVPVPIVFILYYIIWLIMTAASRTSIAKSDLPSSINNYRYRQSWLLFLTSFLPYHVPNAIVYIKDLLIGWTEHDASSWLLAQQMPTIFMLIYLVTFGKSFDAINHKTLISIIHVSIIMTAYQILFGFSCPFVIPSLFSRIFYTF